MSENMQATLFVVGIFAAFYFFLLLRRKRNQNCPPKEKSKIEKGSDWDENISHPMWDELNKKW